MDIQTAARYMQLGYRIKRKGWNSQSYVISIPAHQINEFHTDDLVANDWEVITEGIVDHFKLIYEDK